MHLHQLRHARHPSVLATALMCHAVPCRAPSCRRGWRLAGRCCGTWRCSSISGARWRLPCRCEQGACWYWYVSKLLLPPLLRDHQGALLLETLPAHARLTPEPRRLGPPSCPAACRLCLAAARCHGGERFRNGAGGQPAGLGGAPARPAAAVPRKAAPAGCAHCHASWRRRVSRQQRRRSGRRRRLARQQQRRQRRRQPGWRARPAAAVGQPGAGAAGGLCGKPRGAGGRRGANSGGGPALPGCTHGQGECGLLRCTERH